MCKTKISTDAIIVWGSDKSPIKGKLYSFVKPIKVKSSPVRRTFKNRDNKERKFLSGRFIGEYNEKLNFVGHKLMGEQKDPAKGNIFQKKSKRKYSFELPKDFKIA